MGSSTNQLSEPSTQNATVGDARFDAGATLGDLVTALPGAARVLERHGLDYCCGGTATLGAACEDAGIDVADVLTELHRLDAGPAPDWVGMSAAELVSHIVATHHTYLRAELPRLGALAAKVADVHGERHPELHDVRRTFEALRADLIPHMVKEERVLFPAVAELETATSMPWFPFGTTSGPISVMLREHDAAGELLERLRSLTDGYRAPADGCGSYRALYDGLAELEVDTHMHVHKENNVLFLAVARMERSLAPGIV
jgi:regulator of cell morphogenesis and NO signaling